jgi:hypothetical protein
MCLLREPVSRNPHSHGAFLYISERNHRHTLHLNETEYAVSTLKGYQPRRALSHV